MFWLAGVVMLTVYCALMLAHPIAIFFARRYLYSFPAKQAASSQENGVSNGHHADQPGVSIIKPIVGCDLNLRKNLESFFKLDYPEFELLICIGEATDPPSLGVVQELMVQYPAARVRVFQGGENAGVNPKINNMMPAYKSAQYNLVWICDSNILTTPDTLTELTSHMTDPKVALVHQMPFINSGSGFAGLLNEVYFGTQHCRVYILANLLVGENCAVGMSWLLRKDILEQEGGLLAYADYLAEDFFMGKALWTRGWKMPLSCLPAIQNQGVRTVSSYASRIVRWGRLRANMMPWPGLLEPFTECLGVGVLWALCLGFCLNFSVSLFLLVHSAVWFSMDLLLLRIISNRPLAPVWKLFPVWLFRELLTFPLFFAGAFGRDISWKGQRYRLQLSGKAIKMD